MPATMPIQTVPNRSGTCQWCGKPYQAYNRRESAQRFCSGFCRITAFRSSQKLLEFAVPSAPLPPVHDQRVPRSERRRLEGHSRLIWQRLKDGPASNRDLALLLPPGAAWRTRLSDLRIWLRRHGGPEEPIPHHDCGGGLVYYWLETP